MKTENIEESKLKAAIIEAAIEGLNLYLLSMHAGARPSREHLRIVLDVVRELAEEVTHARQGYHRTSNPPALMRAKLRCVSVVPQIAEGKTFGETVRMVAVSRSDGYNANGEDENNTFARWSPSASFEIYIANPALFGRITEGAEFYVDFSEVAPRIIPETSGTSSSGGEGISADLGGN